MGDELTQFQKDLIRMWDSLRTEYKGFKTCDGVSCARCPFVNMVCKVDDSICLPFNAEKAIEIVTQWAKEHPIITMEDKYKETFGVEPIEVGCWRRNAKSYLCPKYAGFDIGTCPVPTIFSDCAECKEKFWNSEYKKWEVVQNE